MWLVGFPTARNNCDCFQNTFESHLWQALQLCEVFYYFVLHASSRPPFTIGWCGDGEGTLWKSLCRLFGSICREHDSVPLPQSLVLWCTRASARLTMLFRHSRMCLKCTREHYAAHILDLSTQIPCDWSLPFVLSFSFPCLLFPTCVLGLLCGDVLKLLLWLGILGQMDVSLSFFLCLCSCTFMCLDTVSLGVTLVASPPHVLCLMHMWPLMSQCDCVLFACLKKGLGKWWRRKTVSRLWVDRSSWEWSHLSIRPALTLSASLMDWSMPAFVLSTSPWKMSSKAR